MYWWNIRGLTTPLAAGQRASEGMTPSHALIGISFPVLFYRRLAAHIRSLAVRDQRIRPVET